MRGRERRQERGIEGEKEKRIEEIVKRRGREEVEMGANTEKHTCQKERWVAYRPALTDFVNHTCILMTLRVPRKYTLE